MNFFASQWDFVDETGCKTRCAAVPLGSNVEWDEEILVLPCVYQFEPTRVVFLELVHIERLQIPSLPWIWISLHRTVE